MGAEIIVTIGGQSRTVPAGVRVREVLDGKGSRDIVAASSTSYQGSSRATSNPISPARSVDCLNTREVLQSMRWNMSVVCFWNSGMCSATNVASVELPGPPPTTARS